MLTISELSEIVSAKITVRRQVVRTSFLTTNQFDRAGYSGDNIATALTVRIFLTAKTIAITASSFFLLPSSFFLLLYQPSWTHSDVLKPGFWSPCAARTASFRKKTGFLCPHESRTIELEKIS